jgi:hypothetical protein
MGKNIWLSGLVLGSSALLGRSSQTLLKNPTIATTAVQ